MRSSIGSDGYCCCGNCHSCVVGVSNSGCCSSCCLARSVRGAAQRSRGARGWRQQGTLSSACTAAAAVAIAAATIAIAAAAIAIPIAAAAVAIAAIPIAAAVAIQQLLAGLIATRALHTSGGTTHAVAQVPSTSNCIWPLLCSIRTTLLLLLLLLLEGVLLQQLFQPFPTKLLLFRQNGSRSGEILTGWHLRHRWVVPHPPCRHTNRSRAAAHAATQLGPTDNRLWASSSSSSSSYGCCQVPL